MITGEHSTDCSIACSMFTRLCVKLHQSDIQAVLQIRKTVNIYIELLQMFLFAAVVVYNSPNMLFRKLHNTCNRNVTVTALQKLKREMKYLLVRRKKIITPPPHRYAKKNKNKHTQNHQQTKFPSVSHQSCFSDWTLLKVHIHVSIRTINYFNYE